MATTGYFDGAKTSRGWYARLEWSYTQGTSTTITLTLKVYNGTAPSYNNFTNSAYYILAGNKIYKTFNWTSVGWNTLGTTTVVVEGSKTSYSASAQWVSGVTSAYTPASLSVNGVITFPACTSNVGAPSGAYVRTPYWDKGSIIPPTTTNMTVAWWPASDGNGGNTVSSYKIYFLISSSGAVPSESNYSKVFTTTDLTREADGSIRRTFSLPVSTSQRGQTIRAAIQAIGSLGMNSALVACSTVITVNKKPSAPTGPVSLLYSSTYTECHPEIIVGNSNDASQMPTLYYSLNNSTAKNQYTSSTKLPLMASSQSYNFYTFDGLEYSDSFTCVITKNIKPILSNVTVTISETAVTKNSAFSTNSIYATKIKISGNSSKSNGYFKIQLKYQNYAASPTLYNKAVEIQRIDGGLLKNKEISILSYVPYGISYGVSLVYNDGIENSSEVFIDTIQGKKLSIAPYPTLQKTYNQFDFSNISGTKKNEFWNKIRFCYTYDSTFVGDKSRFFLSGSALEVLDVQTGADNNKNYIYYDATFADTIPSGSYTLSAVLYDTRHQDSSVTDITKVEAKAISSILPILTSSTQLNVYTGGANDTFTITFTKFYADGESLEDWSITSLNSSVTAYFVYEGTYYIISEPVIAAAASEDLVRITFKKSTVPGIFQNFPNKNGLYAMNCAIKIVNLYGREFDFIGTSSVGVNFNSSPTISFEKANVKYQYNNSSYPLNDNPIRETLVLCFSPTIKGYNNSQINFFIDVSRATSSGPWDLFTKGTCFRSGEPSYNSPSEFSSYGIGRTSIKEITDNNACWFRVRINDGYNNEVTSSVVGPFSRAKHIAMDLTLSELQYASNKFTFNYKINDLGLAQSSLTDGTIIIQHSEGALQEQTSGIAWVPHNFSWVSFISGKSSSVSYSMSGDFEYVRAKITTLFTTNYPSGLSITTRKISYSNSDLVYNVTPTFAIRGNQLGINVVEPTDYADGAVVISAATGKKMVYFLSANSMATIDMENLSINNFIIDGGSW